MQTAYDRLQNLIVSGEIPPGTHLVETSLAATLGVSRTPIREALSRLEQDGLVERGSRGLYVRRRSAGEILEIYEVRIVLESAAARAAAERHSEVDRIRIQGHLARLEANQEADASVLAAISVDFHRSMWHASHNRTLIDVLERLAVHLLRYPFTTFQKAGRGETSYVEHQELAYAVVNRDADLAGKLASDHMITARNIRLEMWEKNPETLDEKGAMVP